MAIDMQDVKFAQMIRPIDLTGATATDIELDTQGWDYLTVIVGTGVISADMTALKLQENDVAATSEADITGAAWTTFPLATGGDNTLRVGFLDLRKRKRYISIVATGGAGATLIYALAILSRAEKTPTSVTERGADEQFIL